MKKNIVDFDKLLDSLANKSDKKRRCFITSSFILEGIISIDDNQYEDISFSSELIWIKEVKIIHPVDLNLKAVNNTVALRRDSIIGFYISE